MDHFCFQDLSKALFLQNRIITLDLEGLQVWDVCK